MGGQAEWTKDVTTAAAIKMGKIPVIWQPTQDGPADPAWPSSLLPNSTVVMSWLNARSVSQYAQAGMNVVVTSPFYVAGYASDGWHAVYTAPIMPAGLTPAQEKRVLGGQVCVWGEYMATENINLLAWSVGGAAAENFWSPSTSGDNQWGVQDRFNRFLCHLKSLAVDVPPQMPSYCKPFSVNQAADRR